MSQNQGRVDNTAQANLVGALRMAEESKQIGVNTLVKLDEQTEQLKRVHADAEDTEHIIKGNRGVVKDMKRHWLIRFCCYNRSDVLPGDANWDHRDTPEERARVKKMIKLDKKRRRNRRLANRLSGVDDKDPNKKALWSIRRSSDDDSSDVSQSSDSELQSAAPDTSKVIVPTVQIQEDIDEETGLDQLHNTVQDLKVIALQISETSKQHSAMLEGISEQVNTNQNQLDKNQQLVGTLGRRAKDDNDDGILSAQDRLAIAGVKAAVSSRIR
jgi:hypothetical protein